MKKTRIPLDLIFINLNNNEIDLSDLLKLFWECHDPTQGNRQGNDTGSQYRSAIFYYDDKQKEAAEKSLNQLQGKLSQKIVTEITKAQKFWKAEEYHQKYFEKHGLRH